MPRLTDRDRLDLLAAWADDRGYHVEFEAPVHEVDEIDPACRVIVINSAQSRRSAVYALAHECGHLLGEEAGEQFFRADHAGKGRTSKLAVVECELDAWVRGWKLCERLGLGLSRRGYEIEAGRWLMCYVRRAAKTKRGA